MNILTSAPRARYWIGRIASSAVLVTLSACSSARPAHITADQAAIRAVALSWKAAFNAGDAAAVTALYAHEALVSPPGAPLVRGKAEIAAYFTTKVAEFSGSGLSVSDAPLGEVGVSGDLGYQWESYRITEKSGAIVDTGRLLTLLRRDKERWLIVGDTWNSDAAPASRPAPQGSQSR